jgi:hypothetical protein
MTRQLPGFVLVLVMLAAPHARQAPAPRPHTANTLTAPDDFRSPAATVKDLAWFAGAWTGSGLGGVTDEIWSPPAGGAMMGMFRLVRDGKIVFYEFLTLVEQDGSLLLKLKHFNPDLTGWEERANFVTFRLLTIAPDAVHFNGLTFRRQGADRMEIFLALRNSKTGTVSEERFSMTRVRSAGEPTGQRRN